MSITDANVTLNIERGSSVQFLATVGNTNAIMVTNGLANDGRARSITRFWCIRV